MNNGYAMHLLSYIWNMITCYLAIICTSRK